MIAPAGGLMLGFTIVDFALDSRLLPRTSFRGMPFLSRDGISVVLEDGDSLGWSREEGTGMRRIAGCGYGYTAYGSCSLFVRSVNRGLCENNKRRCVLSRVFKFLSEVFFVAGTGDRIGVLVPRPANHCRCEVFTCTS